MKLRHRACYVNLQSILYCKIPNKPRQFWWMFKIWTRTCLFIKPFHLCSNSFPKLVKSKKIVTYQKQENSWQKETRKMATRRIPPSQNIHWFLFYSNQNISVLPLLQLHTIRRTAFHLLWTHILPICWQDRPIRLHLQTKSICLKIRMII